MTRPRTPTTPPPVRPGRFRALRLAARLTQLALARKMGVSAQTIWLIDTDRKQPSPAQVKKLLDVLKALPLLVLLLAPVALAQTVYVAPSGNDSTACSAVTKGHPRRSINGGIQCVQPGGTVELADGTYDELVVGQVDSSTRCQDSLASIQQPCAALPNGPDPEHPTRLVAPGGRAILSPVGREFPGGGGIVTLFATSRNLHFEGLTFLKNSASGSASSFVGGDAQHITVTRSEFDDGTMKSSPNSTGFLVTHNHIHHAGRGCDQSTNPSKMCPHGVYMCGTNHTFTDNLVEYSSYYNVQFSCEQGGLRDIRIERNTVRFAYAVGIRCGGENCVIGSNLLVGNGTAITMSGSGVVAHNTIDSYNPEGKGDPFGIYLSWGDWSQWTVTDNIVTRQKSAYLSINDYQFRTPDVAHVHHNLSDLSGNAGATIIGTPEQVYTNVSQGDYSLRRTQDNPALGTGVPVAQVPTDLRGRPYSTTHPSVGAYALELPQPEPPQPPSGPLVLACTGELGAKGAIALTCTQQQERQR